jgi:hypothetical protein
MAITVVKTIAPQENNNLQGSERCEICIGVGQRAADFKIAYQQPVHK